MLAVNYTQYLRLYIIYIYIYSHLLVGVAVSVCTTLHCLGGAAEKGKGKGKGLGCGGGGVHTRDPACLPLMFGQWSGASGRQEREQGQTCMFANHSNGMGRVCCFHPDENQAYKASNTSAMFARGRLLLHLDMCLWLRLRLWRAGNGDVGIGVSDPGILKLLHHLQIIYIFSATVIVG